MLAADLRRRAGSVRSEAAIWFGSRVVVAIAATYATWVLAGPASTFVGSGTEEIPALGPIAT